MTTTEGFWRGIVTLLAQAWLHVRRAGVRGVGFVLIAQLAVVTFAIPLVGWIFREALRSAGMLALDLSALTVTDGLTVSLALIIVLTVLVFWLLSLQFTLTVLVLAPEDSSRLTVRGLLRGLGRVFAKVARPSSFPVALYLLVILPLAGFGFTSLLLQHITIPAFISGELMKSPTTKIALLAFLYMIGALNVRLAFVMPIFALTNATGGQSLRLSWRLMRGLRDVQLFLAGGVLLMANVLVTGLVLALAIAPVLLTDWVAPDASVTVGSMSLGIALTTVLLLSTLLTLMIAGVLVAMLRNLDHELPAGVTMYHGAAVDALRSTRGRARRGAGWIMVAALTMVATLFSVISGDALTRVSQHPDTLVLAHRGFSDGGVENTISGLEASAFAGADLVEIDVMQTRDGGFVVMHDVSLSRLADDARLVKDLTLAELTAITVHDQAGHADRIPSLEEYLLRAEELGMPLLIEIKLSGAERENHVDMLIEELESLGVLEQHIYHSLDPASVARLKLLRPNLTVGYTMAFAGIEAPDTPADFIVVEGFTATEAMQEAAAKARLGFMVWTVNEDVEIRNYLRRDVDGIITDHPDRALSFREEIDAEDGLAPVVVDIFLRSVLGL